MSIIDEPPAGMTEAPSEPARRYWELWQDGSRPDLEQFLDPRDPLSPSTLAAVLCVDMRERWRRRDCVSAEFYLDAFSRVRADPEAALDIVYCEYLIRDGLGESPCIADYTGRFPELEPELGRQVDVHRALRDTAGPSIVYVEHGGSTDLAGGRASGESNATWPVIPGSDVLGRLGHGGMGVVYKAWQGRLHRDVAVKMILPGFDDAPSALARFRVEAEAVARLRHPNIVQLFELGDHDGRPYLVMELADGGSLAGRLTGAPWPGRDAAWLIESLARAVHYAHEHGVLHRDLTPGNVLFLADGTAKLSDFGLAKLLGDGATVTRSGALFGTPSYMAPEQAGGSSQNTGPSVDVYGLGAILYELLTGRPPFKSATQMETLSQVLQAEPVAPRQLQPNAPLDLETICLKCLRKEPGRRYVSALGLAQDLERFLQGRPIEARPVGALERAWRWGRRNRGWAAMMATTAALLVLIAVSTSLMSLSLRRALNQAKTQEFRAESAEQAANEALRQSYLEQAQALRLTGVKGQRFQGLAAIRKALRLPLANQPPAELRNAAIACLVLPDVDTDIEWEGWPTGTLGFALDAGFERYVRVGASGTASLRRVADDREIASLPGSGRIAWGGLLFSPDGRFLQHRFADGRVKLWRLDGAGPVVVFQGLVSSPGPDSSASFRWDSRQLAVSNTADRSVRIHDTTTGKEVRRLPLGGPAFHLAFRPGSTHLAVGGEKVVRVFDLDAGNIPLRALSHPEDVSSIAWHPEGRILATTCDDLRIRLWDVSNGMLSLPPLDGHHADGMSVEFNHSGDRLASKDWGETMRLWDSRTGRQLLTATGTATVFSADDRGLGAEITGSRARLLRIADGRELQTMVAANPSRRRRVYRHAWYSPDGRFLMVDAIDSLVVLDPASGGEVDKIPFAGTTVVAFEPGNAAVLTWDQKLVLRWPIRDGPAATIHVGPPRIIGQVDYTEPDPATGSPDGSVLVFPNRSRGAILLRRPANRLVLGPREDVRQCAISPDGRWVATGNFHGNQGVGATVWDAQTGKVVKDLTVEGRCSVAFSPDGRWLVTGGGTSRLWRVGTWEESSRLTEPNLRGAFAFSPDSKVLALAGGARQVLLVDPETGSEIARLTAPEQTRVQPQCFSPDGTQLVAMGPDMGVMYIWDLRAIRSQLKEIGLDWDRPDYPPSAPAGAAPLRLKVDCGSMPFQK